MLQVLLNNTLLAGGGLTKDFLLSKKVICTLSLKSIEDDEEDKQFLSTEIND